MQCGPSSVGSSAAVPNRMRGFNPDVVTGSEQHKLDALFMQMLIHCSLAFAIVEQPATIAFLTALRPAWRIPNRKQVGGFAFLF